MFYALPIGIPDSLFSELKTAILKFIWIGKIQRVAYKTLCSAKEGEVGFVLPDLWSYYRVAQLRVLVDWSSSESHKFGSTWIEWWQDMPFGI